MSIAIATSKVKTMLTLFLLFSSALFISAAQLSQRVVPAVGCPHLIHGIRNYFVEGFKIVFQYRKCVFGLFKIKCGPRFSLTL